MAQNRTRRRTDARAVRVGASLEIPSVLRSLGVAPAELFAEAGLDIGLFGDPDNLIAFDERSRLIKLCVERTGCAHFGLLVGAHNGLHSLGVVGLLMKYAPDVGTALDCLVRHLHLHVSSAAVTLAVAGSSAALSYEIHLPRSVATDQICDGAVATMFNLVSALCGPDWRPTAVLFTHRKPAEVAPFKRILHAPLRFDAESNALVFRAADLKRRIPAHDPPLYRLLQRQIDLLEAQRDEDLPGQVRAALHAALTRGAGADVARVSALFAMHSRTLNRRLGTYGTSFRQLVDDTRFERARQLLESSALDVREIALQLDYANASAFTRAFRRWSGTTPAQWRSASPAGR